MPFEFEFLDFLQTMHTKKLRAVDQFPMTVHLETVCLLEKIQKGSR